MTLHHPQGVRLKIQSDRLELWAPVEVKSPWWAFWRKPMTVNQPVACAGHENRNGDILGLRNIDSTYQATIQRRLPDRNADGEYEYAEEEVVLEWKSAQTTMKYRGMGPIPLSAPPP